MKLFDVSVLGLKKIYDMPGTWNDTDYRNLLSGFEVDDVDELSGGDLLEILMMVLQDLGPEDAGETILEYKLSNHVTKGVRQNIVQDLLEGQRAWEETADIYLHADIFAACVLLKQAFPKVFPRPDLLQLRLQLIATGSSGRTIISLEPEAAFVARVLADGMSENSILERLFDEQLAGNSFPEAEGMVWQSGFSECSADGKSALLTVYSSEHWLESMEDIGDFPSNAYNDRPDEGEE